MYPNEFTRNPFFAPTQSGYETLTRFQGISQSRCSWGGCNTNHTVAGTRLCEEHALQIFDHIIAHKGYDYMLARAGGVRAALEYEKEHIAARVAKYENERKERATREGWVYYIRIGDLIKIGYASNVWERMRAYPPTAELLAAHPGTLTLERSMHRKFGHLLDQGREWFKMEADLVEHIGIVLKQFPRQPEAYEFRKNTTTYKAA